MLTFETNPSFGKICPDRSQGETEWQEQGAREAAWKLAKSVLKLKEHERATFLSPYYSEKPPDGFVHGPMRD